MSFKRIAASVLLVIRSIVNFINRILYIRTLKQAISNFTLRNFLTQTLSLLLLVSLLVNSTPAAPSMVIASSLEFGQDVRYAVLTSPTLAYLSEIDLTNNFVFAFFFNSKKKQTVAKIEVSPKKAVIREGEEIPLTAVALDSRGNPIQGVNFKWSAVKINPAKSVAPDQRVVNAAPVNLENGVFAPQFSGVFEITAQGGGMTDKIIIRVLSDSRLLATKEATEIQKNNGNPQANKRIRADVQKELSQIKPFVLNNSTRMSKAQTAELNVLEKNYLQANPVKKELDPNKKYVPIKKAPRAVPVEPNQIGKVEAKDTEETTETENGNRRGGPSPVEEENGNNTKIFYPDLSGYLNTITGSTITGCGYDGFGWTGATIDLYIDGDVYTGTYIGGVITSSGCNFSMSIPSTYQDGQVHNVYAYIYDYNSYTYFELDNSPQPFQIGGGGGGGGGTNSNWNNNNFQTADNPGTQTGTSCGGKGIVCIDPPISGTDGAGSSNFGFSAPVLSLGGRGMDVNLSLNYNSLLWHNDGTNINYDIDKGFPGPGWNIGFGKVMDMGSTGGAMLEDINGARHSYEGVTQSFYGGYSTYYGKTNDGSFIDYQANRSPAGLYSATAYLPNGMVITYGAASNGVLYPTLVKDRNGNYLTIAYQNNQGPRITNITDNLGRIITFNYDGSNRLTSISGPGFNGSTRVYVQLHYTQQTLSYGFTGLTPQVRDASPFQLDAIYYPGTNTGYWFGDNNSYSSYGMIAKVSERRGMSCNSCTTTNQGTITAGTMTREMVYNYPMTANSALTTAPQYTTMTEDWAGRDVPSPAVTSYSINNSSTPRTTIISLPNGNQIKQSSFNINPNDTANLWKDGLLYQVETHSSTNQFLSKSVTAWEQGDYNSARVTQIETTDEKIQTTKQTFVYDTASPNYNQVATISEYGYSNNLLRKSVTTYENGTPYRGSYTTIGGQNVWVGGRHIFSLVKTQEIQDAANVRLSRNDISYDQVALVNTPGVVMYDQTYNPYTTEMVQGNCINWDYQWNGWDYEYVCTEYEQVPNFDSSTLARGNATTTTTYSDAANLTGAISYVSTYDITGNARTTTTNCCQQMSFNYTTNTQYSQPDSHTKGSSDVNSPYRMTESATYDFNTGAMKTSTDFNGRTTSVIYDAVMRPVQTILPTGGKSVTDYDDVNMMVTQTAMESNNNIVSQGQSFFNGRGQTVLSKSLAGATWNAAQVKYDIMGRQIEASLPYISTGSPTQWTKYTYDLFSRVTQVEAPDGSISQTVYNDNNKPGSAASNVGNTVRSIDAWGRERWARTDDFGRLVEVVEPDPNGNGSVLTGGNMVTTYSYDPLDQLVQVNQGVQERKFAYDSLGRLVRQKLAEQANTIEGLWSDAFVYDNRSNLVQRTDARGVKTKFNYELSPGNPDPLNRLQSISYDKTTADTSKPIWDAATVTLAYMTTGDKTRVSTVSTAGISTETNTYDIEGRVSEYNITLATRTGHPLTMSYLYDTTNRLTEVRYPAQYGMSGNPRKTINPTYDNASRLTQLTVNSQIQMSEIAYNPMSQVTQLKTGAATGNADIEQYSYDAQTGLLTNQKVYKQNTSQTLLDLSYNYQRLDANGNPIAGKTGQLTKIIDNLNQNRNRFFEFDTLGRLKTAKGGQAAGGVQTQGTPAVTANWTQNYGYDRYGNRLSVSAIGVTQNNQAVPTDGWGSMSYQTTSNRTNTSGYEYDLAGSQTRVQIPSGAWQRLEYDAAGRLVVVKADDNTTILETYTYGVSRQRLITETPSQNQRKYYAWGGSSVLCEYTEALNSTALVFAKSYIYAGSRLLSTQIWNGSTETTEFHHPDRLGTKLVTNNAANTFYEQSTLPFGTSLDAENVGTPTTNLKFTSYDRSASTSLDYAQNRNYSSGQGRFTSVDPIGMNSGSIENPQSNNLYAYTQNNPIDFTDPSGLLMYSPTLNGGTLGVVNISAGDNGAVEAMRALLSLIWFSREMAEMPTFGGGGTVDGGTVGVVDVTADPDPVTTTTPTVNVNYQQENTCHSFVDMLISFGLTGSRGMTNAMAGRYLIAAGWNVNRQADGGRDLPVGGFRDDLIGGNQRGHVYRHLFGHAGGMIIGNDLVHPNGTATDHTLENETGIQLINRQYIKDINELAQARRDRNEVRAAEVEREIKGDIVGRMIGGVILSLRSNRTLGNKNEARETLMGLLCQP